MCANNSKGNKTKVSDLAFAALFESRIEEGRLFFNRRRAIILDVEALGALRQQLIATLGEELAMGVLARFGYAHGYGDAKMLGENFSWETETDWLAAGPFLHILEGIVHVTPEKIEFDRSSGHFHMLGTWLNSYEAEIHLKLAGRSAHPVCWTLTGYASGYASGFFGRELLAVETECLGRGDQRCRFEIRPAAEWGAMAEPYRRALKAVDVINQLQQVQLVGSRFRDMALSSSDWVWEADARGRYEYCSGQVQDVLGYEPGELVGRTMFELMPPAEADRMRRIYQESVRSGSPIVDLEYRAVAKDGTEIVLLISGVVAAGGEGGLPRVRGVAKDITGRKRYEEALRESEERYRIITESALDAIITIDEESRIVLANPAVERIFGYPAAELHGRPLTMLMPERLRRAHLVGLRNHLASGRRKMSWGSVERPGLHRDGREFPLEISYGEFIRKDRHHFIGIARDITERKQAEEALKESRERFRTLTETTGDLVWEVDADGVYTYVSPQVEKILGYAPGEVLGKTPFDLMPPEEAGRIAAIFQKFLAARESFSLLENINLRKDGARVVLETSGVPFFDAFGALRGYRGIDRDITERKKAEETIRYQLHHDLLTGLPNRTQLMAGLQHGVATASRQGGKVAVLHLDLDRFRAINDSLGHAVGDEVIMAVARRLKALTRESDTLARIGSDEFVILLPAVRRAEEVALFARKVVEAMRHAYRIDGRELYVTASIGISLYPEDGGNGDVLLGNADVAISHAKERGRNNFQFFNPALHVRTLERLLLESSLRRAIERRELVLYYQPQVSLRNGEVTCLEALARWQHADLGLLAPADFIPVAEEIGFIPAIDEWVLRQACAQNKAWQEAGYPPVCVTVNLSSRQFQQPTLVGLVTAIVREAGLDPEHLDIEITEGTAMRDIELAIPNIKGLNELGIKLSIDDFGTGYSSLNYLKRFSVHTLKIDQSFIRDVTTDPDDQAIVKAVIAMGHNLQLKVIAEGVETDEQRSFLVENGCDGMQGFLFSEPLPAGEVERFLAPQGGGREGPGQH